MPDSASVSEVPAPAGPAAGPAAPRGPRLLGRLFEVIGFGRLLALALLVGVMALRIWDPVPIEFARLKIFDFYQLLKPREPAKQPIAIIDLDEESMAELGQWPWPRTLIAKLVAQLAAYQTVAVAFDFVFPEPDRTSPAVLAEQLPGLSETQRAELAALPDNDAVLAATLAKSRVVLGQSGFARRLDGDERPIEPHSIAMLGPDPRPYLFRFNDLVRNLPVLEEAAMGRGSFTILPERDGVVRRVPALITVGDTIVPTLSLELLRLATGQQTYAVKTDEAGVKAIVLGGVEIPTDSNGRLYVYFSPFDQSRYISAKDVINGTVPREALAGRVVFFGTSATGLLDIKSTPVNDGVPGVEVHVQLLEAMLTGTQLVRPNYAIGAELVMGAVVGLGLIVIVPLLGAIWSLAVGAGIAASLVAGSWYLFSEEGLLIDVAFALSTSLLLYAFLVYENYIKEEAQKRQVRGAFSQYLSPALVEQLAAHPERLVLGGETREMTFLFCDVRGFTSISEQFSDDPAGLTSLINRLLTPLTSAILEREGTIDKYMGDCIMAFWNAPLDDAEHALNACEAALDMLRRLEALNSEREREAEEAGLPFLPLNVGIGLNTGNCTVGNMGSDQRFDYSVLGDAVNLASRLEGQSKTYGATVVIGDRTAEVAGERVAQLELDLIAVKGKTEPERIFALLGDAALAADPTFGRLRERHAAMLAAYRGQDWAGARRLLGECRDLDGGWGLGELFALYEARIADFEAEPPGPDWDGVYVATTK